MTTTTFGYDAFQDRIWMRAHEQDCTVWLTRRMVTSIVGPLLKAFEGATPGAQGGAKPATRAAIEHKLSLNESVPGQPTASIRAGRQPQADNSDPQRGLCSRITSQTLAQGVVLSFDTAAGPLVMRMSRQGMHLWLRGLALVLKQARWDLQDQLPPWLVEGVLPAPVQALLDRPLPDDLGPA